MTHFSQNLAVVVGIDQYSKGIRPLQTAVNDVKAIAQRLQQDHHYQVIALVDQQATLSALRHLITAVLPQQVKPDSRVLFYFAGHGIALNGEDGPEGYLIPQDARAGDTRSYLAMPALQSALSALPCRHFLGVLDCCFAGAFRWSSSTRDIDCDPSIIYQERYDRFVQDPAWQILTSAASDQTALDAFSLDSERTQVGEHSPFAAAFIEALEGKADVYPLTQENQPAGDGVITATELYAYLRDRIEIPTDACGRRQTPGIHPLKKHDKGEYIFLTPGHPLNLPPAPPLDISKNPYRGLHSFEAQHSALFFGRSKLVKALQEFVETRPLTVVLGASGSGKSSLVKAGLIPALKRETKGTTKTKWCVLSPVRLGETPCQSLNKVLVEAQIDSVDPYSAGQTLAQSISTWVDQNPRVKLLLFIDQSEEIITLCLDEAVRRRFFQQILNAIALHREQLRVVLTLRSDFEPQIRDAGLAFTPEVLQRLGSTELKRRWQRERFVVPAMIRADLREAIEKPAEARVMHFQPDSLIDQLIDEVADMPGALPLLSFALSELYLKYLKRQHDARIYGKTIDRALTVEDYRELGGVIQSLTQRADEEYQSLVQQQPDYAQIVGQIMLRMVALNGGELARRRVLLSELIYPGAKNLLSQQVIAHFTRARLLVEGQDAQGNAYVEPAHDALVRGWQKMQIWLEKEKNLALQRRVNTAALEWYGQQHKKFLWHDNHYLDVLNKDILQSVDSNWLNQVETKFVQQSVAQKRRNKLARWSIVNVALLVLGATASVATKYAIDYRNSSLASAGSEAVAMFTAGEGLDALEKAVEVGASMQSLQKLWKPLVSTQAEAQIIQALQQTYHGIREQNRISDDVVFHSVSFSGENQMIATGLEDGSIKLWSRDGQLLQTLSHETESVDKVAFARSGEILVTASKRQGIKIWEKRPDQRFELQAEIIPEEDLMSVAISDQAQAIATTGIRDDIVTLWDMEGSPVRSLETAERHRDRINDLSFSDDGRWLVTGSADETVKLWDLSTNQLIRTIQIDKVVFSVLLLDEKTVAVGTKEGTVELWPTDGTLGQDFRGRHRDSVDGLALSPDKTKLVSRSADQTLNVWDISGLELTDTIEDHEDRVTDVSFSDSSDVIISTSQDRSLRLWQFGRSAPSIDGTNPSFSPDQRIIATAEEGNILLWRTNGTLIHKFTAHSAPVTEISFSPQGNTMASAAADGAIKLWALEGEQVDGKPLKSWTGHQDTVASLRFSPNGETIASGSVDKTIKLWSLEGALLKRFAADKDVTSVEWSPDGSVIASAGRDQKLSIWRLDSGAHHSKESVDADILDISFSPQGDTIASANADGSIRLWNLNSLSSIHTFSADVEGVTQVQFMPTGSTLISRGRDGAIKQWTLEGDLLQTLHKYDRAADITLSPDGKMMASVDGSSTVIRDLDPDSLLINSCRWLLDFHKHDQDSASLCSSQLSIH